MAKTKFTRFPVVSLGAEYLVMGYLMRRNILAYKAPPNNEGYDLICIHPDPRKKGQQLRVQVKSRTATDCDRGFPVKAKTIEAFDYLVAVFLNVGYFLHMAKRHPTREGAQEPELYTFPRAFIKRYHNRSSTWEKVLTRGVDIDQYKNEAGIELIAKELKVPYPRKRVS